MKNDPDMEMAIRNIAMLATKYPKYEKWFWEIADNQSYFEQYVFFGVVHAMAYNREYRDLHDIKFTDKELRKARGISNSLLDSLATVSY